jgi:hypothetical protein
MSTGLLIFTLIHVALSLVAWVAGIVVVRALLRGNDSGGWVPLFLVTAVATSATGFGFPFGKLLPSHIVGVVALAVLAVTILARYAFALAGPWRRIYAAGIVFSLFFDTFVLVAQAFGKIPPLHALAPTGNEPAFGAAEVVVLLLFVYLTVMAIRRFGARPATV